MISIETQNQLSISPLKVLKGISPGAAEDFHTISHYVKTHFSKQAQRPIKVLEAGCGRQPFLEPTTMDYRITGVDASPEAIALRNQNLGDLEHSIVDDITTIELPEHEYDIVCSSYVLEHVDGAEKALENFCRWLKPDGLLIIRMPDPSTAYSFLAKHLPFWMHVVAKRAMGSKMAGKPGYDPFPTFFDPVVSRAGMYRFCQTHNLDIKLEYSYGFEKFEAAYPIGNFVLKTLSLLSLGKLDANRCDLLYIIEKQSDRPDP